MRLIGILGCALVLAACSGGWGEAQTSAVADYTVTLRTDPAPLEVGRPAMLIVKLRQDGKGAATGCNVSFRQYMPGMEMSGDHAVVVMQGRGKGIYGAASAEYSMGGDWRIEVMFNCDGQEGATVFDYALEWPE